MTLEEGFTVLSGLVGKGEIEAARRVILAFVGADLDRPDTWYAHEPLDWSVVPVHHAQAFWDIRQNPRVHAAFASLQGTERLWVTMDRGIYKVPRSAAHPSHVDESVLHWDRDPRTPGTMLQGMLYLTDTTEGQGPFESVPSIYRDLPRYLAEHPAIEGETPLVLDGHTPVEVPLRAGDLLVWDARLPHHGGANHGRAPRLSFALSMHPEGSDAEREQRIGWWRERRAPPWWRGVRGQVDPEPGAPAILSELGRRLVGIERWP